MQFGAEAGPDCVVEQDGVLDGGFLEVGSAGFLACVGTGGQGLKMPAGRWRRLRVRSTGCSPPTDRAIRWCSNVARTTSAGVDVRAVARKVMGGGKARCRRCHASLAVRATPRLRRVEARQEPEIRFRLGAATQTRLESDRRNRMRPFVGRPDGWPLCLETCQAFAMKPLRRACPDAAAR